MNEEETLKKFEILKNQPTTTTLLRIKLFREKWY